MNVLPALLILSICYLLILGLFWAAQFHPSFYLGIIVIASLIFLFSLWPLYNLIKNIFGGKYEK